MTKPTPHGQVPEAPYLQLAYLLASGQHLVSAERKEAAAAIRDLHAENEALRTAHVQNPAAIEQVAGDVSKNGVELNMSTQQPVAQQGAADGFFLLLPQRPKPEAPAGTAGLGWDAYSGAQMLAFGRDCSDAAIAALRTQQPAPAVPAGWKAVPVNPTPEMWKAAKTVPDPNPPYPPHYGLVWDAMLAASPTPPAEQQAAFLQEVINWALEQQT